MTEKWDRRFLRLAHHISTWSKDPSTKVGAVAIGPNKEVRSQGYNGFPRGVSDDPDRYADRTTKYLLVVHAEMNVCLHAARNGVSLEGCSLYVTFPPCSGCAGSLLQVGFREIVIPHRVIPDRWVRDTALGEQALLEGGTLVRRVAVPEVWDTGPVEPVV